MTRAVNAPPNRSIAHHVQGYLFEGIWARNAENPPPVSVRCKTRRTAVKRLLIHALADLVYNVRFCGRDWFWAGNQSTMKQILLYAALPVALVVAHLAIIAQLEGGRREWYLSEMGPAENLTFLIFLAGGVMAIIHFRRSRTIIPRLRWFILTFGVVCIFVGLEEISYGQHFMGITSPEAISKINKSNEINIHNLGDDEVSRFLRRIAEIGLPVFGIILPLVLPRLFPKTTYRQNDWTYFLLPRHELVVTLSLCLLVRVNHEIGYTMISEAVFEHIGEVQELLWSLAGLFWILVVGQRLAKMKTGEATIMGTAVPQEETAH